MTGRVLIILPRNDSAPSRWLRIAGETDTIAAHGRIEGAESPLVADGDRIIAIVPGEAVSMTWLPLEGTTPAQLAGAARHMVAERSALSADTLHVAIATSDDVPDRTGIATTDRIQMQNWLARLQGDGVDPDVIIPDHMLLPVPAQDALGFDVGANMLAVRAEALAMTVEADLARAVLGTRSLIVDEKPGALDAAFIRGTADMPLNLRSGSFQKASRFQMDGTWRRSLLWAAAIPALLLLTALVTIWRTDEAADTIEADSRRVALAALPPGTAEDQAVDLLLSGSSLSQPDDFTAASEQLMTAIRSTAGVTIDGLEWDGTRLAAELILPAGMTAEALRPAVESSGYRLIAGAPQPRGAGLAVSVEVTRP